MRPGDLGLDGGDKALSAGPREAWLSVLTWVASQVRISGEMETQSWCAELTWLLKLRG